jgi:hypothetical protein
MTANEWASIAVAVGTLTGFLVAGVRFLVKSYLSELKPNGGSSVKDKINEINQQVERLEARIDEIYCLLRDKRGVMSKVVEIAKAQIGYKESNNNNTIFGKWYGANNQPWCATFVSWCFNEAGLISNIAAQSKKGFASCDAGLKWFAKKNKVIPIGQAQAGDIVFFQFDDDAQPDHVGIVKWNNTALKYLQVIEGNTSSGSVGSQSNGDGVYLRKRSYSLIMGVVRP